VNEAQYRDWVSNHIAATGGDAERLSEVLWANLEIVTRKWHASYEELCECSERLIEAGRVPQFPAEHTNAIWKELCRIRDERERANKNRVQRATYAVTHGPQCDCIGCAEARGDQAAIATRAKLRALVGEIAKKP
jgi:hypothetical protein